MDMMIVVFIEVFIQLLPPVLLISFIVAFFWLITDLYDELNKGGYIK